MAVMTFPLGRAEFMDLLPIAAMTCDCPEQVAMSRTGSGEVLSADVGPRLWQGSIEMDKATHAEVAAFRPLLNLLRGAGRTFMVSDVTRPWPRLDPRGDLLGTAIPKLASVAANMREISLKDLPAGYQLSRGDLLSFSYGAAPIRYALHELVGTAIASGAGITGLIEVSPALRPGAAVDAVVTLVRPFCKAMIIPGSVDPGRARATITEGIAFDFIQTLR